MVTLKVTPVLSRRTSSVFERDTLVLSRRTSYVPCLTMVVCRQQDGGTQGGREYEERNEDGMRHGKGTQKYANGGKYAGQWEDDLRHGQGTYTGVHGSKYKGSYEKGNRHGNGTLKPAP